MRSVAMSCCACANAMRFTLRIHFSVVDEVRVSCADTAYTIEPLTFCMRIKLAMIVIACVRITIAVGIQISLRLSDANSGAKWNVSTLKWQSFNCALSHRLLVYCHIQDCHRLVARRTAQWFRIHLSVGWHCSKMTHSINTPHYR